MQFLETEMGLRKDAEKILKYKDHIIEIQCTWKVKAK
jgi:hypothetical protein